MPEQNSNPNTQPSPPSNVPTPKRVRIDEGCKKDDKPAPPPPPSK